MHETELFFDNVARTYDEFCDEDGWNGPQNSFSALYPFLSAGNLVLEFGSGTGRCAAYFGRAKCQYRGLEISSVMIDQCREKHGQSIDIVQHNLSDTPYPVRAGEADHVVCTGTCYLLSDLACIHAEAERVLKPGGMFFIDYLRSPMPKFNSVLEGISSSGLRNYLWSEEKFENCLRSNKFVVLERTSYYFHVDEVFLTDGRKLNHLYFQGLLCRKES